MPAPSSFKDSLSKLRVSRRKMQSIRQAYMEALEAGVKYYGDVLIRSHFSNGNQARMGWPDLSEKYRTRKLNTVGPSPMLVSSGDLRNSVVGKYVTKVNKPKYSVTLEFNSAEEYGAYLETGSFAGAMGARPWKDPTATDVVKIDAKVQEEFKKRLQSIPAGYSMRKK